MEIIIHDKRPEKEFNNATFSDFKKSEVTKALTECINKQEVEQALSWCVELLCSGRLKDIWDCFLLAMGKHIRGGNPKLAIYMSSRFEKFKNIIGLGYGECELELRNCDEMRSLLAEITLVLCYSPKKPPLQMLKVKKGEDYSLDKLGTNLKADNMEWCKKVMTEEDPMEILLPVNEFAYHFEKKNLLQCCYWVDWMIDFDALCRKQKKPIVIKEREFIQVDGKFIGDPVWLFWELLLKEGEKSTDAYKGKIIKSLIELFSLKYNFSQKRKRRHLLYLGIEIFTETLDMNASMIHQSDKIKAVLPQIDKFYKAIKKYEQQPDVLSDKQRNLAKSINKMKMVFNL